MNHSALLPRNPYGAKHLRNDEPSKTPKLSQIWGTFGDMLTGE